MKPQAGKAKPIDPVYIKVLLVVLGLWIISTTLYFMDLYTKVGKVEHILSHMEFEHYQSSKGK